MEDTLRRICPRDHLHKRDPQYSCRCNLTTGLYPKLNSTNEYNHATHVRSAKKEANQKWSMCSKFWSRYHKKQGDTDKCNTIQLNQCFANRNEEVEIYPLPVKEIVEAQKANNTLKQFFKSNAVLDNGLELILIENKSSI